MKCPYCNNKDTKVSDTRTLEDNSAIRRRRYCDKCGERFTTYERLDTIPLTVVKKNGTREAFDREKIMNGILRSCNKRPVTVEQIEQIVNDIENSCLNSLKKEIETSEIGEMVMAALKEIDDVSYVRFASVYRHFKDVESFMKEIGDLLDEKKV